MKIEYLIHPYLAINTFCKISIQQISIYVFQHISSLLSMETQTYCKIMILSTILIAIKFQTVFVMIPWKTYSLTCDPSLLLNAKILHLFKNMLYHFTYTQMLLFWVMKVENISFGNNMSVQIFFLWQQMNKNEFFW